TVATTVMTRNLNTHFKIRAYPFFTRSRKRLNQYLLPFVSSSIAFCSSLDESIGTKVTATTSDAISENDTASASGVNISDAIPSTNTIGRNTTKVVVVDAMTAGASSDAPLVADSNKLYPRCR